MCKYYKTYVHITKCMFIYIYVFIKNNKAPGSDCIPIDLIKHLGDEGIKVLTAPCQNFGQQENGQKIGRTLFYIPIPTKGDARECANNRTLMLISHCSKVTLKIIHSKMEEWTEQITPYVQAQFRKRRGTQDQIANVRWTMERSKEYKQDVFLCFIDYSKAFDFVDHPKLWNTASIGISRAPYSPAA